MSLWGPCLCPLSNVGERTKRSMPGPPFSLQANHTTVKCGATGRWWEVDNCVNQQYGFWLDPFVQFFIDLFGFSGNQLPTQPLYPNGNFTDTASCNSLGLSA